jgi:hypothetical protein
MLCREFEETRLGFEEGTRNGVQYCLRAGDRDIDKT